MSDDVETVEGEIEAEVKALTPRQAVLLAVEELRHANRELNGEPGDRPSVMEHQATIAGIAFGLSVLADRLADDEGLRPAVAEALEVLSKHDASLGSRVGGARRRLMAAVNL